MSVEERASAAERVLAARERYVARGVSTPALVVARAEGARVWDVDGREFLDFAGGIACQNLGHGPSAVVAAIHDQVDRYLHQCFMVGTYEPYIEVCRRLDELWPGDGPAAAEGGGNSRPGVDGFAGDASSHQTKSILVNSGAEAIENAVKIARAATGRAGVVVFDRAFHGRTNLTMEMTAKLVYKQGFGPLATDVYRAAAPYPFRGVSTEDALDSLELLFQQDVDPKDVACIVLEPVQGEGGFIPMPPQFVQALRRICDEHEILYVDDEVQSGCGRTGTMWAIEQLGVEPDLLVAGKTIGGGLPLATVTGRAELMDAVHVGGLGGTFGGNPVACAAALAVLDELTAPGFRERAEQLGSFLRARLEKIAARQHLVGEVRGLGPMLALELRDPLPDAAKATTGAAFEKGLLLLSCGLYGNVIRLLPPLTASDEELERGLSLLEEALGDAGAGGS
jgi:4-aminobutyrate aminotransferase / (S)-3-amino-2-methylpropionate transaminase / 5-aminovalerate transaminase